MALSVSKAEKMILFNNFNSILMGKNLSVSWQLFIETIISARLITIAKTIASVFLWSGAFATLQLIAATPSQAEGSKEMTSDASGYRPWFNSPVGGYNYQNIVQQLVANVYVNAGETINVGSSGIGLNGATIILKAPNGTTYTANGSGSVGVINNRSQENAGPLPNIGGYTPYSRTVLPGEAGIWQVTFISPGSGAGSSLTNNANWTRSSNQGSGALLAWDVTVRSSGGSSIPGRTYLTNLGADMFNYYPNVLKTTFYVLTKSGFIYQVKINNLAPYIFNFFSNNKGFTSGGNPTYKSLNSIPVPGTNVFNPNSIDSGTDINNKMFLNDPRTAGLPTSASHPAAFSTWLLDNPIDPVVGNFSYTPSTSGAGGTFNFSANVSGSYNIELDTNNNGFYTDAVDRTIQGLSLSGNNSYVWDGKDGAGNIVSGSNTFTARFSTRSGEVHFPVADAESNPNGFTITRLNGAGAGDSTIFWDDTLITITGATKSLAGTASSPSGAHSWGSTSGSQATEFGNNVGIDTWAFTRSAFVFTQVGTTPSILLVKRITAVNGVNITTYINDPNNPYDDNILEPSLAPKLPDFPTADTDRWPNTPNAFTSTFLVGSINGGTVKPKDTLEYTIYFLSAGTRAAKSVLFCDRVPTNVTFLPYSFNTGMTADTSGVAGADRGIAVNLGGTLKSYTNLNDGDIASYFPPGSEPSAVFPTINCGGANDNGAVVVNLGNLPNATAPGIPASSYGFVRFQGQVK